MCLWCEWNQRNRTLNWTNLSFCRSESYLNRLGIEYIMYCKSIENIDSDGNGMQRCLINFLCGCNGCVLRSRLEWKFEALKLQAMMSQTCAKNWCLQLVRIRSECLCIEWLQNGKLCRASYWSIECSPRHESFEHGKCFDCPWAAI